MFSWCRISFPFLRTNTTHKIAVRCMCCVGWHGLVPTELADRGAFFCVLPPYPTSFSVQCLLALMMRGWVFNIHRCVCVCVRAYPATIQGTETLKTYLFPSFYLSSVQRQQADNLITTFNPNFFLSPLFFLTKTDFLSIKI